MRLAGAAGGVIVTVAAVESDEVRPRPSTVRTVYDSAVPEGGLSSVKPGEAAVPTCVPLRRIT